MRQTKKLNSYLRDVTLEDVSKFRSTRGRPKEIPDALCLELYWAKIKDNISWDGLDYFCKPMGFTSGAVRKRITLWTKRGVFIRCDLHTQEQIAKLPISKRNKLIIDSTMIRNSNGIDNTGRIYSDRFRRGNKLTLIINEDKIPMSIVVSAANVSDIDNVSPALGAITSLPKKARVLADKGYVGEVFKTELFNATNISLIYPQRKNSKTQTSTYHKKILKKRCFVEHVFAELSRYKAVRERSNKSFSYFKSVCHFVYNNITCNKLGLK